MYQRSAVLYAATSGGASITALTGRGYFMGIYAFCSGGAGSLILADSGAQIMIWSGGAAANLSFVPVYPVACTAGLSVTGSGAIQYAVMYSTQ
jgi:hypothetical protein